MGTLFSDVLCCDVLVVGGGAAGIRAALTAAELGLDVALLSETPPGQSGSSFYPLSPPWGVLYAEDAPDAAQFYQEIISAAGACVDERLVRVLAEESTETYARLTDEGLPLRTHASLGLVGCFGKNPRGAVLEALEPAVAAWHRALRAARPLRQVYGWQAATLLSREGEILGATAVNAKGELLLIRARSVILATGGAEGLYERAYANGGLLGAGYAMAARHGARTVNLEFVQFINGTLDPVYGLNYYHFALAEQPKVTNALGEEFLGRYLPAGCTVARCLSLRSGHGPFSVEDDSRFFDLAIAAEARSGHGDGARITPDPSRLNGARYAHWRSFLQKAGYTTATPMTIAPFCQAFNGGVRIFPDATTDVRGLYACGEAAGGSHGANRMGGNAILATQVFGRLAAQAAARYCRESGRSEAPKQGEALRQFEREMGSDASSVHPEEALREVRQAMQASAFLERDAQGLGAAQRTLAALKVDAFSALGTPDAWQAVRSRNAVDAARLILHAMERRRESRGGHNRVDYPARDEGCAGLMDLWWRDLDGTPAP